MVQTKGGGSDAGGRQAFFLVRSREERAVHGAAVCDGPVAPRVGVAAVVVGGEPKESCVRFRDEKVAQTDPWLVRLVPPDRQHPARIERDEAAVRVEQAQQRNRRRRPALPHAVRSSVSRSGNTGRSEARRARRAGRGAQDEARRTRRGAKGKEKGKVGFGAWLLDADADADGNENAARQLGQRNATRMLTTRAGAPPLSWLAALLLCLCALPLSRASALTTTIPANERTCFYALVDKASEKVSSPPPQPLRSPLTLRLSPGRLLLRGQSSVHHP